MTKSYADKDGTEQPSHASHVPGSIIADASERTRVRDVLDASEVGTRLRVAPVGAPSEAEADRIAQRLLDSPAPVAQEVAASAQAGTGTPVSAAIESQILAAKSHGASLGGAARAFFEARLGRDLDGVRIHADSQAEETNRALESRAFAIGQDVFFRPHEYSPNPPAGRELLAHELAHTTSRAATLIHRKAAGPIERKGKVRPVRIVVTATKIGDLRPIEYLGISVEDIPDTIPMRGLTEVTPDPNTWIYSDEQFEIPLYVAVIVTRWTGDEEKQ